MKIGIIGFGFVGSALANGFKENVKVLKIDPKLQSNIKDLKNFNPDAIFICVPTPMNDDFSQDISILKDVLNQVISLNLKTLIVIKSTVLPSHIKDIESLAPSFVYNPEFLREQHADDDFINSKLVVFGGCDESSKSVAEIYKKYTKCIYSDYVFTDLISASFIKYSINSFLSTKVIFFNELYKLFSKSGSNDTWDNFTLAISKDPRLGNSHMQVPGHDGRFGFGGACLPKDSNAFSIYSDEIGEPLNLLKKVIKTNNKIRATYNDETERELEQNIKFNGED